MSDLSERSGQDNLNFPLHLENLPIRLQCTALVMIVRKVLEYNDLYFIFVVIGFVIIICPHEYEGVKKRLKH